MESTIPTRIDTKCPNQKEIFEPELKPKMKETLAKPISMLTNANLSPLSLFSRPLNDVHDISIDIAFQIITLIV